MSFDPAALRVLLIAAGEEVAEEADRIVTALQVSVPGESAQAERMALADIARVMRGEAETMLQRWRADGRPALVH